MTWLDLHNLLGIVTVLWALVVGLTGVINTFDRPLLAYWQMTEIAGMLAPWKDKPLPGMIKPVDDAVRAAEAAAPDMIVRFIAFPGTPFAGLHHYMVFMREQSVDRQAFGTGADRCGDGAGEQYRQSTLVFDGVAALAAPSLWRLRRDAAKSDLGAAGCHHDHRSAHRTVSLVAERKSSAEDLLMQTNWAAENVFSSEPSAESR